MDVEDAHVRAGLAHPNLLDCIVALAEFRLGFELHLDKNFDRFSYDAHLRSAVMRFAKRVERRMQRLT